MDIIAGVCTAETEDQVFVTAKKLHEQGVKTFRAGVWKARTRPNSFMGVGITALKWLDMVKEELGMKVAIEVATPKHLEMALRHNVDIFWIGARTTVNPFSVQDLADAFCGVNKPVFIKNPINPDVELWTGAVERIQKCVKDIKLIHRGFSVIEKTEFRNKPIWGMAEEMSRRFNYDMYLDPSHMGGSVQSVRKLIPEAYKRGYDGLFVECHYRPSIALCDKKQQLTPYFFKREISKYEKLFDKPEKDNRFSKEGAQGKP